MRTSYSAIQTFKQCPKRYQFKLIDKVREPKTKEQQFGTWIHECLRFMFLHDPLFPTLDQVIEHYNEGFPTENWHSAEVEIYKKQGEAMLRKFYAKNAPWNFVVLDLESRFEVVLEDPKTKSTHILAGIIDRIDKLPDGRYEIIDYKTQKRMPPQERVDRDLQLSIYAMGLKKRWPHLKPENIKLSLQFLKHEEKLSTSRTEGDFKNTEADVVSTIREIESKIENQAAFEPLVSPLCDFCAYKPICPAWKHLYKNVASEVIDGEKVPLVMKEYFDLRQEKAHIEIRLKELGAMLTRYLAAEEIDRVFSDDGVISKRRLDKYEYDFDKIRALLLPLGKWEQILKADERKLAGILKEIPAWVREEIKKTRVLTRSSIVLAATRKKNKA